MVKSRNSAFSRVVSLFFLVPIALLQELILEFLDLLATGVTSGRNHVQLMKCFPERRKQYAQVLRLSSVVSLLVNLGTGHFLDRQEGIEVNGFNRRVDLLQRLDPLFIVIALCPF